MMAIYRNNPAYPDNPFIEALPPQMTNAELMATLNQRPQLGQSVRQLSPQARMAYAAKVYETFVPLDYTPAIYNMLYQGMLSSFAGKNSVDAVRQMVRIKGAIDAGRAPDTITYQTQAASGSILGVPGIGKSSTITRILGTIPQVIEHESYMRQPFFCKQINYLNIQCPNDCSVKAACTYILAEIDRLLGTRYAPIGQKGRAYTLDAMIAQLSQLCLTHHIGVIIIDEIQNIMGKTSQKEPDTRLIKFMVQLMNDTGICAVLVGTPEVGVLFDRQPHLARRTRGLRISALEHGAAYNMLLAVLWEQQCTGIYEPLNDGLSRLLYEISGGIPALLGQAIYYAQQHAITSGAERLSEAVIREAANLYQLRKPSSVRAGTPASAFELAERVVVGNEAVHDSQNAKQATVTEKNEPQATPPTSSMSKGRPQSYRDADDIIALYSQADGPKELKKLFQKRNWLSGIERPC